jgi:hypothetical protein
MNIFSFDIYFKVQTGSDSIEIFDLSDCQALAAEPEHFRSKVKLFCSNHDIKPN